MKPFKDINPAYTKTTELFMPRGCEWCRAAVYGGEHCIMYLVSPDDMLAETRRIAEALDVYKDGLYVYPRVSCTYEAGRDTAAINIYGMCDAYLKEV